jgi:hypothetical protein
MTSIKICSHPYILYKTIDITPNSSLKWNCNMCKTDKTNSNYRYRCLKKDFDVCLDCCEIYGEKKMYNIKIKRNTKDKKYIFKIRSKIKGLFGDASYFMINTKDGIVSFKTVFKLNKEDISIMNSYGFTFKVKNTVTFKRKKTKYTNSNIVSSNIINKSKRKCSNKSIGFYSESFEDVIIID